MIERGYGLACPRCEHPFSATDDTRGAPDRRVPLIRRERTCASCGLMFPTLEVLAQAGGRRVRLPDPDQLLAELRRGRSLVHKSGIHA